MPTPYSNGQVQALPAIEIERMMQQRSVPENALDVEQVRSKLSYGQHGNLIEDKPLCIQKHQVKKDVQGGSGRAPGNQTLYFKVLWQQRANGKIMMPTYYKYEQLEETCTLMLLRYFRQNAVLYDNNPSAFGASQRNW